MIAAVVNGKKVENLIVLDSTAAIPALKAAFGYELIIPVGETVQIGDTYDPDKQIFTRDGVRVYPPISDKERIAALEAQTAQLENALCEVDEANAERFAAIEDALCEIDAGSETI